MAPRLECSASSRALPNLDQGVKVAPKDGGVAPGALKPVAGSATFHLIAIGPLSGLSPDGAADATSVTFGTRWTELRQIALATCTALAIGGSVDYSANDLDRLDQFLETGLGASFLAAHDLGHGSLAGQSLHLLSVVFDRVALSARHDEQWEVARTARYLADLCRVRLLDFTTTLLLDSFENRWPGRGREAARQQWSSSLLEWLRLQPRDALVGPALERELPLMIRRHKPRLRAGAGYESASRNQFAEAVDAMTSWVR